MKHLIIKEWFLDTEKEQLWLNTMSEDGWELICVVIPNGGHTKYYFRKQVNS